MAFRVPNNSERVAVMGMTGGGKTQGGVFLLSRMNFTEIPWVILDFKREALFQEIMPFDLPKWEPPRDPGIYRRTVTPYDMEKIEDFLLQVHAQGNCGIFVDEGYELQYSQAFKLVLTQGRSLQIPVITCTQRPKLVPVAVFSEANFFMIYNLTYPDDKILVAKYVGRTKPLERLKQYYFYWYDVIDDRLTKMRPVPDRMEIARVIRERQETLLQQNKSRVYI